MQLHKTERARAELRPGVRTLSQRERTLLLLADGSKSAQEFRPLFDGDGEEIALRLLREGFLAVQPRQDPNAASASAAAIAIAKAASPQPEPSGPDSEPPQPLAADQFDGKRSLATTRMFLFDICERMFSRRDPAMAEYFREALRNAKDRQTMLATSRQMLEHIEIVAGHERADSLSERIAMLMPAAPPADALG